MLVVLPCELPLPPQHMLRQRLAWSNHGRSNLLRGGALRRRFQGHRDHPAPNRVLDPRCGQGQVQGRSSTVPDVCVRHQCRGRGHSLHLRGRQLPNLRRLPKVPSHGRRRRILPGQRLASRKPAGPPGLAPLSTTWHLWILATTCFGSTTRHTRFGTVGHKAAADGGRPLRGGTSRSRASSRLPSTATPRPRSHWGSHPNDPPRHGRPAPSVGPPRRAQGSEPDQAVLGHSRRRRS